MSPQPHSDRRVADAPEADVVAPPAARDWQGSWALKGLFGIALVALLKLAEPLLTPVLVAVVLTFVLAPGVRGLRRRGVPEVVGAGVLVLALLLSGGLLAGALVQPAQQWLDRAPSMVARLVAQVDRVRVALSLGRPPGDSPQPRAAPPPAVDPLGDRLASEGVAITGALLGRTVSFTVTAAATVILLYFLLASEHWMLSRTVEALPRRRTRALLLSGVRSAQRDIGRFIGALTVLYVIVGIVLALALAAIGMPNPALWGTMVAVVSFVPYLGPIVIVLLLLMAGLVTFGSGLMTLAPAAIFLLLHAIEANIASPYFIGRRLTLSPLSVFLSVMFWGWLWGLAGAVFAVPLLVGVRSVCKRNRRWRLLCVYLEGDSKPPPTLRSLLRAPRPRNPLVPVRARDNGQGPR